ncbi:MAG: protein kinase [Alphaproteobacteria bacterium]|nr:protein kinase [Alphaproteobacteria bacterium]MCB9698619.1 protein kinase [Alphaproteobacteria bacterium]
MPEFRIQRCLGRGGFGEVYRAVMVRGGGVDVDVAVKVLRSDLDPTSQGMQRLRDEGRLLGRLTHPAILRVYDLVVIDGHAALVSEYIDGDDLARLIKQEEIPARAAYEAIAQVADALDAAWSWPSVQDGKPLRLVHRDIKPDNVRIEPVGTVKLLDFGIAQASSVRREANTSVNIIMGSTQYLSPERLVQQEIGPEADVFALGCTLFEALTGEALFVRKSMRQMYLLMIDESRFEGFVADRTETFRDRIGGDRGIALIRAMTAWRKQNRPTAAEVAARCDTISDSTPGPTLTAWCRTRQWAPPPDFAGSLEGRTFQATSLGLDSEPPPNRPPRPPGFHDDVTLSRADTGPITGDLSPYPTAANDITQRLGPPKARQLDPTPDPALSRWADEPTDGNPRRRGPVLGEAGHQPTTGDLEQVAAADPNPPPWSEAEMVALYASHEGPPARSFTPKAQPQEVSTNTEPATAPVEVEAEEAPPDDEPSVPDIDEADLELPSPDDAITTLRPITGRTEAPPPEPEPVPAPPIPETTTESNSEGTLTTARLPVLLRQRVGVEPMPAIHGPTLQVDSGPVFPPDEPTTASDNPAPTLGALLDASQDDVDSPTVKIQRKVRTRPDGTPIPRRRMSAEPITAPRFVRTLDALEQSTPDLLDRRDTTMPMLAALDGSHEGAEPTLRVPALKHQDPEITLAGALETARTPEGAMPRKLPATFGGEEDEEAATLDAEPRLLPGPMTGGLDELPESALPELSDPRPPQRPLPEPEPEAAPPVDELPMAPPPISTAERTRPRPPEPTPFLAAGASLVALLLGVAVLLLILIVAVLVRS